MFAVDLFPDHVEAMKLVEDVESDKIATLVIIERDRSAIHTVHIFLREPGVGICGYVSTTIIYFSPWNSCFMTYMRRVYSKLCQPRFPVALRMDFGHREVRPR